MTILVKVSLAARQPIVRVSYHLSKHLQPSGLLFIPNDHRLRRLGLVHGACFALRGSATLRFVEFATEELPCVRRKVDVAARNGVDSGCRGSLEGEGRHCIVVVRRSEWDARTICSFWLVE